MATKTTSYRLVPIVKRDSTPNVDFEERPSMTRVQILALLTASMPNKSLKAKAVQIYKAIQRKVDVIPGEARVAYKAPYLEVRIRYATGSERSAPILKHCTVICHPLLLRVRRSSI